MSFHLYGKEGRGSLPKFEINERLNDPSLYKPSSALINAVNVALNLGQPLLLTGEPGTGKTQLAYHISWFFQLGEPLIFNAQTTSNATDLFYRYDALAHFQYNQNNAKALNDDEIEKLFVHYQALGRAIIDQERKVVLLDEIDKAPRDLPNDVLAAIEKLRFDVPEINKTYETTAENRPIIIMTSNSEKNLPDAFLRRVVYYHIPFPDASALLDIVSSKVDAFAKEDLEVVIQHFDGIRKDKGLKLKKLPATAELIFWANLLKKLDFNIQHLTEPDKMGAEDKEKLMTSYSVLAKTKEDMESLRTRIYGNSRRKRR
ncbi:MAG: MoxR family ATPase [Saprospiraceae bacterium]|nr:MoxR family ATPase [Saprospiraceae bacterium]